MSFKAEEMFFIDVKQNKNELSVYTNTAFINEPF